MGGKLRASSSIIPNANCMRCIMRGASVCREVLSCREPLFSGSPLVARLAADRSSLGVRDGAGPDSHPARPQILQSSPHPSRLHPDWRERAPTQASSSCVSTLCPPDTEPSASDLRAPDDRTVSWKRDVRVFHKGSFPSSRSFLIHLDVSWLDPFTNVLPRTTLDPPSPVTRVIRLALPDLLRSPTPGGASLPISLSLIGSLTWFKTRTPTGLLGSRMNLPYRAASKHLGAMGE